MISSIGITLLIALRGLSGVPPRGEKRPFTIQNSQLLMSFVNVEKPFASTENKTPMFQSNDTTDRCSWRSLKKERNQVSVLTQISG